DGALRTASQLNNLVHRHSFVTALQKQIGCDFLELAVSNFATRTLFPHCSPSQNESIGVSDTVPVLTPRPAMASCKPRNCLIMRFAGCILIIVCTLQYSKTRGQEPNAPVKGSVDDKGTRKPVPVRFVHGDRSCSSAPAECRNSPDSRIAEIVSHPSHARSRLFNVGWHFCGRGLSQDRNSPPRRTGDDCLRARGRGPGSMGSSWGVLGHGKRGRFPARAGLAASSGT